MTPDETAARLLVLETFTMTALAIALEREADPGHERARALLRRLREAATGLAGEISPMAQDEAEEYGEKLSALVLLNLRNAG